MRFFSILLASAFLAVVGCGGGDETDGSTSGVKGPTGSDLAPAGMDPKNMPVDVVKDDEGNVVDPGGKEEPPEGASVIPKQVISKFQGGGKKKASKDVKKETPKKDKKADGGKKETPKKDKKADGGKKKEKKKG